MSPLLPHHVDTVPAGFTDLLPLPSIQDTTRPVRVRTSARNSCGSSIVHTEIAEDCRHVNLHGSFAQLERQGYFLVRLALNEKVKNVSLPRGQKMHGSSVMNALLRTRHFNELRRFNRLGRRTRYLCKAGRHVNSAVQNDAQRFHEVSDREALQHISMDACLQGRKNVAT